MSSRQHLRLSHPASGAQTPTHGRAHGCSSRCVSTPHLLLTSAQKRTLHAKKKIKIKRLLLYTLSAFASLISQITAVVPANEAQQPPVSSPGWAGEGGHGAVAGQGGARRLLAATSGHGRQGRARRLHLAAPEGSFPAAGPGRAGPGRAEGWDRGRGWRRDSAGDIAAPPAAAPAQAAARRWRPEHGAAGAAAAQAALLLLARRPQPLRPPGPPERRGQAAGKAGGAACRGSCPALPGPARPGWGRAPRRGAAAPAPRLRPAGRHFAAGLRGTEAAPGAGGRKPAAA